MQNARHGGYHQPCAQTSHWSLPRLRMPTPDFSHSIDFSGNVLSPSRPACDFNALPPLCLISLCRLMTWECHMGTAVIPTRENRTTAVDFQDESTYERLLGDGRAFLVVFSPFSFRLGFS